MAKKKKVLGDHKLYRNAGISELVFEGQVFEPGSEFRATLPPEQEMQLLAGGHLEVLQDQSAAADKAQSERTGGEKTDASARTKSQ
jgi:hypothetical protein